MSELTLINALLKPSQVFRDIASNQALSVPALVVSIPVMLVLPAIFLYLGTGIFGWRLGSELPLFMDDTGRFIICVLYSLALFIGFFCTVFLAHWMGETYGARKGPKAYFSLLTVVFFPISIASIAHLYPNGFLNVLVLLPTLIWCMSLLYRGLPVALEIPPERGMLMSTSLVGWLLVGAVSVLGISVGLWTAGIGPTIAV